MPRVTHDNNGTTCIFPLPMLLASHVVLQVVSFTANPLGNDGTPNANMLCFEAPDPVGKYSSALQDLEADFPWGRHTFPKKGGCSARGYTNSLDATAVQYLFGDTTPSAPGPGKVTEWFKAG